MFPLIKRPRFLVSSSRRIAGCWLAVFGGWRAVKPVPPLATLRTVFAFRAVTATLRPGADLFGDVGAGRLIDNPHRQLDLAALVEADDLDLHGVALVDHVGGLADAALLSVR